jgi:retinol dehydrogenase-12
VKPEDRCFFKLLLIKYRWIFVGWIMQNQNEPLQGKICLITGATSGIGKVTARELARKGASLVIVSRNPLRCENTIASIQDETGNSNIEYMVADLSSQDQIRQLARGFMDRYDRLDVLINNAGAIFLSRKESVDGIEMTWALNHLNYFLLTNLLLDILKASAPARIVNVASTAHRGAKINFDDLQGKRHFYGMRAYSQSKLANVLFTYELARRLEGTQVTANALHPGFVASNFAKNNGGLVRLGMGIAKFFAISPEKGAETSIYLASSPDVEGVSGRYFVNKQAARSDPASYNEETARKLWQVSEEMTGLVVGQTVQVMNTPRSG